MKKRIFFSVAVLLLIAFYSAKTRTQSTLEQLLKQIPFIDSIIPFDNDSLFLANYVVWFQMPIDHNDPNSPTFPLKAYYSHLDFNKPMVAVLDGYTMYTSRPNELTRILHANQLTIEHRFFSQSRPKDSIPWQHLNVRQAAADQHKIIEAFKPFYKGKWVSTGISKSGQTTIMHRRFYPNDVDVSVPYVAPLNFSSEEPRVYDFLKNVSTPECRDKIYQYQIRLFENKQEILPLFEQLCQEKKWDFKMGVERALELSILEYPFAFWQWGMPCDSIPSSDATPSVLFKHIHTLEPFTFFEEKSIENVRPFFYQAMTEMGMYGYEVEPFKKYLKDNKNVTFEFTLPKGYEQAQFNPQTMLDVDAWLKEHGHNMLYIYGEYDSWSATAVDPGNKTNAVIMFNPEGSHSTRIFSFPPTMRDSILTVLEQWVEVDLSHLKSENLNF